MLGSRRIGPNLLTQDEQVACFCNAAAHLDIVATFYRGLCPSVAPPPTWREPGCVRRFLTVYVRVDEYDIANQETDLAPLLDTQWSSRHLDSPHRYAWPAEYDLMARIAGLTLRDLLQPQTHSRYHHLADRFPARKRPGVQTPSPN